MMDFRDAYPLVKELATSDMTREEMFGLLGRLMRNPANWPVVREYLAEVKRDHVQ
jgi:hypothetical protein